jgi:hypothetical protein
MVCSGFLPTWLYWWGILFIFITDV